AIRLRKTCRLMAAPLSPRLAPEIRGDSKPRTAPPNPLETRSLPLVHNPRHRPLPRRRKKGQMPFIA
ncbi:MAG: hypothetical protein U9N73_05370, partial [Candidatus Auribacterota bacterium]|nr:hypothetical protein [Candidatus Auribacterota bacterium]